MNPTKSVHDANPGAFAVELERIRTQEVSLARRIQRESTGAIGPDNPIALYQQLIAGLYLDQGLPGHAQRLLEQAAKLQGDLLRPGSAPRTSAGRALAALLDNPLAIATDVPEHEAIANLQMQSGRFGDAAKTLRDAGRMRASVDPETLDSIADKLDAMELAVAAHDNWLEMAMTDLQVELRL